MQYPCLFPHKCAVESWSRGFFLWLRSGIVSCMVWLRTQHHGPEFRSLASNTLQGFLSPSMKRPEKCSVTFKQSHTFKVKPQNAEMDFSKHTPTYRPWSPSLGWQEPQISHERCCLGTEGPCCSRPKPTESLYTDGSQISTCFVNYQHVYLCKNIAKMPFCICFPFYIYMPWWQPPPPPKGLSFYKVC